MQAHVAQFTFALISHSNSGEMHRIARIQCLYLRLHWHLLRHFHRLVVRLAIETMLLMRQIKIIEKIRESAAIERERERVQERIVQRKRERFLKERI